MSNTPAVTPKNTVELVRSAGLQEQVAKALPNADDASRFMRCVITACNKNPKLWDCTKESVASVILQAAQWGLMPDGHHAHLIPYGNDATLQFDYKGILALVMRSGEVAHIHADIVCQNDKYRFNLGKVEEHVVDLSKDRGEAYAVYAMVRFKDGETAAIQMSKAEVEAIRKASRSGSSGPWATYPMEMWKKTAFKRLAKWLPRLPRDVQEAIRKDNEAEYGQRTVEGQPVQPAAEAVKEAVKKAKAVEATEAETAKADEPIDI
jgi:recombination protein RecT